MALVPMIPLIIDKPVCAYCGQPLQVGEHVLILQADDGTLFDAHAACHERELNTPDEDEPLHVH